MPPDGGIFYKFSGETGIRTLGTVARTTVFETAPFDRSGISPVHYHSACKGKHFRGKKGSFYGDS